MTSPSTSADHHDTAEHPRLAVAILCAAGIVVALMQTIIVPLIPDLPAILGTSPTNASWALTITLLVGAVVTPISGRLGDMIGKRLVLIASLGAVAAGSVVCALSSGLALFLIGRGVQGLGIGTIAVGISLMRDIVPPARLGSSIGAMSASLGVGGSLGLPFAAVIAQQVSWHALFWVSAAVGVIAASAVAAAVPRSSIATGGRFDLVGAIGLTVLLSCILLALSKGDAWGWSSPAVLGLFAAFVVSSALWWRWEKRVDNPLIDLATSIRRPILLTNIASVATGFAFYAMQIMPIQVLEAPTSTQTGVGLTIVEASLVLMPSGLVMFAFSYVSAWMTRRFGARVSLASGGVVIGVGYLGFLLMIAGPWHPTWGFMVIVNCFVGAGLGVAYSAMPALIMDWVPVTQTGEANGVNALMRSVGTSTATAVIGMILAASVETVSTTGGAVAVPSTDAYVWASIVALVTCALATVAALGVPASRLRDERVV
ncbi:MULTISPECIES: MFS transporter [Gordonia]|uniref:Putative major facilitator superfamily transporter n=1 Tax=Gordonia sihwensis NBRC 108236 TaxID=1223544 RepID=L7LR02_9ACTN|nr:MULTISPECIES: MFS transporter [Gordonia]GAC62488.1 putative major facilitator superfamily transporter [Gordonia sihwensis NBRC 108236]